MLSLNQHNVKAAPAIRFDKIVPSSGRAKCQVPEAVASVKLLFGSFFGL